MNQLEKSVLATIKYYDIFDYPLTGFEVFKYLINPVHLISKDSLEPIKKIKYLDILEILNKLKSVKEYNGFYFLKNRNIVDKRIKRQKISIKRWKKVKRIIKVLKYVPFVKMISVCNGLAINNSKKSADIDLFIIIKKSRIFITRFLITFTVWAMGQWRHNNKISNKICLSFYITDDSLNLKSIKIQPFDIYLASWVFQLKPVYSVYNIYERFIKENKWVESYFFNYGKILNKYYLDSKDSFLKKFFELIFNFNFLEKIFKFIQIKKMKKIDHSLETAVVVSDSMLKFHENDKREFFQNKFKKSLTKRAK
ncbi:MAG: hypothetical protein ABIH51_00215 [Patescibacteria group bacterium]